MKLNNLFLSAISVLLASPLLAASSPVPEEEVAGVKPLAKRNAWTVYLFSNSNCNFGGTQGGYSDFGSFGCTNINSDSVEADTQGCTVVVFGQPNCQEAVHVFSGGDTCFGVLDPVGGALQSFRVDC
ncbi:hypothetical protein QBC47DRAFT_365364 [Echria macrotheca]|uniref:Uncharacterized protein n=1 Tax=Echria macrotheca TaxID=438768 RepID=A0AAJ0B2L9_9PEZI|nr:hypothetical protein QBC47DRAFT_365364 [Echria macrotheca]